MTAPMASTALITPTGDGNLSAVEFLCCDARIDADLDLFRVRVAVARLADAHRCADLTDKAYA